MDCAAGGPEMDAILHTFVPMRDGARLATSVFLPKSPRPCPVALVRTAYNRVGPAGWSSGLLPRGCQACWPRCLSSDSVRLSKAW